MLDKSKSQTRQSRRTFELNGKRTAVFIMDISSNDQIPAIAEPMFNMGCKVEFHPAMNFDDLKRGVAKIPK